MLLILLLTSTSDMFCLVTLMRYLVQELGASPTSLHRRQTCTTFIMSREDSIRKISLRTPARRASNVLMVATIFPVWVMQFSRITLKFVYFEMLMSGFLE